MIALLCVDLMNEYLDPNGKLSEGTADFVKEHNTMQRIARIEEHFREQGGLVVHVHTGFSENYPEFPTTKSKVFNGMKEKGALLLDSWGTETPDEIAPHKGEPVIRKHRVGPFDRTRLEIILRTQNVKDLYIIGGLTLGTVSMSAYEAHDMDFNVCVISDGCYDKTNERHELGLKVADEVAEVKTFSEIAPRLTRK